jgi:hypothetical protein
LVQQETLAKVRELCGKVGHSLSLFVLKKYAGVTDPGRLGFAKLTGALQKLTDISNGVDRLRRAATVIGDTRYSAVCREIGLASEAIDDIPDRDALKTLLARVEAEATDKNGPGSVGSSAVSIGEARGQLLRAARKAADRSRKRLADVIAEASDGKLSLEELKNLTEADVALVTATTARVGGGGDV